MIIRVCLIIAMTCGLVACFGKDKDDRLVEGKPNFLRAAKLNVEMGEAYLAQGQISRAKKKFVHALELRPKLPEAHSSFGYFYESVGDLPEAERHYKRAISYARGEGKFYNNYATFLCRQSRYREADKAFNKALEDKKHLKTAEVYENAGVCAMREPNHEKARFYLETALKRDPTRTSASLELAKLEFNEKRYKIASDYLQRYRNTNTPNSRALYLAVQLNKVLDNKDEIASAALQLKELFPESNEYQAYLELEKHG